MRDIGRRLFFFERSFFSGFLSAFDLYGLRGEASLKSMFEDTDADILMHDWRKIGDDFYSAIDKYGTLTAKH